MTDQTDKPVTLLFPTKSVSDEALKNGAVTAAVAGGVAYGLLRVVEGLVTHNWNLRSGSSLNWKIAAGAGVLFGALAGHDKAQVTTIKNERAELLNKYAYSADAQATIIKEVGVPEDYKFERSRIEKGLDRANTASFLGWAVSTMFDNGRGSVGRSFSNVFFGATALTALGGIGQHMHDITEDVGKQRQKLTHAEKVVIQRSVDATLASGQTAVIVSR